VAGPLPFEVIAAGSPTYGGRTAGFFVSAGREFSCPFYPVFPSSVATYRRHLGSPRCPYQHLHPDIYQRIGQPCDGMLLTEAVSTMAQIERGLRARGS